MKQFLLRTAIAVTLVSATSVVFAESSLSAFEGIASESVEALELDAVSGKGLTSFATQNGVYVTRTGVDMYGRAIYTPTKVPTVTKAPVTVATPVKLGLPTTIKVKSQSSPVINYSGSRPTAQVNGRTISPDYLRYL